MPLYTTSFNTRTTRRTTFTIDQAYNNLCLLNVIVKSSEMQENTLPKFIIIDLNRLYKQNLRLVYFNYKIYIISTNEITPSYFIPFETNKKYIKLSIECLSQIYKQPNGIS